MNIWKVIFLLQDVAYLHSSITFSVRFKKKSFLGFFSFEDSVPVPLCINYVFKHVKGKNQLEANIEYTSNKIVESRRRNRNIFWNKGKKIKLKKFKTN
jgi:hypothetical protein